MSSTKVNALGAVVIVGASFGIGRVYADRLPAWLIAIGMLAHALRWVTLAMLGSSAAGGAIGW